MGLPFYMRAGSGLLNEKRTGDFGG